MSPIIFTEITNPEFEKLPIYKLDDLFLNYDDLPVEHKKRNAFRVRFYALRIDPQALNPNTLETYSCSNISEPSKGKQ